MPLVRPDPSIPLKALFLRVALIFLPVVVILSIAILLGVRFDEQRRLERTEAREKAHVEIARSLIAQDLFEVNSDMRFIASLPSLRQYLDSGSLSQREELTRIFLALTKERRRYDQVRYLDATGREVIRINYNDGKPAIVPRAKLQDKSERYYFSETIKLGRGEMYVSPLDLNVEQGQLERPYKPMIRFGMPVFDSAGRKRGMILLNYLGGELLQRFRAAMQSGDSRNGMLLNSEGYWLSNSNVEDEWGFMLGQRERSFSHDFPGEWRIISYGANGMLPTANGLFVYDTVYPLLVGQPATPTRLPSGQELKAREYRWKIVSFVSRDVLFGSAFYRQPGGWLLIGVVYLLFALTVWVFSIVTLSRKQARAALLEALAKAKRFGEAMNNVPVYIYLKNKQHRYTYGNRLVLELFGCTEETLPGSGDEKFFPPEAVARLREIDDRVLLGETTREEIEVAPGTPNHRVYWEVKRPFYEDNGEIWGLCGVSTDITERKRIEAALRQSSEEIEDLYNHAPCGYHSLDESGLIVRINHTELDWLGYRREEVVNKLHIFDLMTPASQQTFRDNFPRFKESGFIHDLEFDLVRKDGTILPVLLSGTAVRDVAGRYVMSRSTIFDLTERKKLERELERQARTDVLTGLNNRRHFFELAEKELARVKRRSEPLSLLMLDVDHFKQINDTCGHPVGDLVLQKLGKVCLGSLRGIDVLGRIGGEEFALLLPGTGGVQARETAERLRLAVAGSEIPSAGCTPIRFTVSIGVACFLETDADVDSMLKRADEALYAAKNAGRNRVQVYDPEMAGGEIQ